LRVGAYCKGIDAHTVECPAAHDLSVWTHGRADRVRLDIRAARRYRDAAVVGGDGNDTIIGSAALLETLDGGAGDDVLAGGPGHDVVFGMGDDDVVSGGGGNDRLWGDGPRLPRDRGSKRGGDDIVGGPGRDIVAYAERDHPVSVDLRRASPQGAPGEGDSVKEVEAVEGGDASDRLIGDASDNMLVGSGGEDVFRCGAGFDVLRAVSSHTTAPGGCEGVRTRGFEVDPQGVRTVGGQSEVLVPVTRRERRFYNGPHCRAVVELAGPYPAGATERPPTIGTGTRRARLNERAVVHVNLNEHGRELLARPGRTRVLVSVRGARDCVDPRPERAGGFTLIL
jgi:Ca2+-binding RTX toxin-like protein